MLQPALAEQSPATLVRSHRAEAMEPITPWWPMAQVLLLHTPHCKKNNVEQKTYIEITYIECQADLTASSNL